MDNDLKIEENKTKRWFGEYKGIGFEINNFTINGSSILNTKDKDSWTYYLIINLNRVDRQTAENLWLDSENRYYYSDQIMSIDLHGGCTYYSKIAGFDKDDKVVKIGCDYQHIWDEGHKYDIDYVLGDVKNSVNSFLNTCKIKHWCNGNGKLYDLSEGKLIKGMFYSEEYWKGNSFYDNA